MSETTADVLRRIEADLRGIPEDLPALTLLAALRVPLPPFKFSTVEDAPEGVANRLDGCAGRRCMKYVAPTLWAINHAEHGDELVTAHQCGRCRAAWRTSWLLSPEEMVAG